MKKRVTVLALLLVVLPGILVFSIYKHGIPRTVEPALQIDANDRYTFFPKSCWFNAPWQETIRCGELHTATTTGEFVLPVVIIEDTETAERKDAVFYLQGGPGSSAGLDEDGIRYWLRWRDNMALGRDLVLMDPRGTGRGRPTLRCQEYDELSIKILKRDVNVRDELREGYAVLENCFAALRQAKQPFNPEDYGTQRHAQDVQALMDLLPYEQWNLIGVSYGTRVALEAAQSKKVRSMILDSVYPANRGGMISFPSVLDQAFVNFFRWCTTTNECAAKQPVEEALDLALKKLRDQPLTLTVARRGGEVPLELVVNDHRFISTIFSALYNKHQWPRIPKAIEAVLNGEEQQLMSLIEPFVHSALSEDFHSLVFMAVDCRDHGIPSRQLYQQELSKYPRWSEYTRDLWEYQSCHLLSPSKPTTTLLAPLPAVPALILAGELDPITPVEWAEALHREWPTSQLHVVHDTGHAVINSDDCVYRSLRSFLDAPNKPVVFCAAP